MVLGRAVKLTKTFTITHQLMLKHTFLYSLEKVLRDTKYWYYLNLDICRLLSLQTHKSPLDLKQTQNATIMQWRKTAKWSIFSNPSFFHSSKLILFRKWVKHHLPSPHLDIWWLSPNYALYFPQWLHFWASVSPAGNWHTWFAIDPRCPWLHVVEQ